MRLATLIPIALLANSAVCAPSRPHLPSVLSSPTGLIRTSFHRLSSGDEVPTSSTATNSTAEPAEILSSIKGLNSYVKDLNKAYAAFSGRAEEALGLASVSDKLYKQMDLIISQIEGHKGEFTLLEAANVGSAFLDFMPNSVAAIAGLKDKKEYFDKLGGTPVLVQELKKQKDQADRLKKALKDKIPEVGKDTADSMYGDVSESFDKAIEYFSKAGAADWNAGTEASAEDLLPS